MNTGIFFDLDGTLIDSKQDIAAAVNFARRESGLPELPLQTVADFTGDGMTNLVRRSFSGTPFAEDDRVLELTRNYYSEHEVVYTVLYPGVDAGLKAMAEAGARLFLVTNKPQEIALGILEKLAVKRYFTSIIGGGGGFALKPAPDALLGMAEKYQLNRQWSWILGDHYTDLAAGRRAGVRRALAKWGFGAPHNEYYDAVFDDFPAFTRAMLYQLKQL